METSPRGGNFGIAAQDSHNLPRPGLQRARLRVAAAVQVDPNVRVLVSKNKPQSSPPVGLRVFLLPPLESTCKTCATVRKCAPCSWVRFIGFLQRLWVDRGFGQLSFPRSRVDAVFSPPVHPLRSLPQ